MRVRCNILVKKGFRVDGHLCYLFKMDDESSVNSENNVDITTSTEKKYLIDLIKTREYINWSILR